MTRGFGLDGLDLEVAAHLPGSGVFVEAGAHDGLTQSNTAMLELSRGWRGLLVEPIPELARRCRANRPAAVVEQVALVAAGFPTARVRMTFCNRSSIVEGGRGSPASDRAWIERCRRLPGHEHVRPYTLLVPARTLSSLLEKHGLDFRRHRPAFILVEVSRARREIEEALSHWYVEVAELSDHRDHDPPWYDVLYRAR